MSDWWSADPVAAPRGSEGPRSNSRGTSIDDVQAAVRGDMLNSPSLPIKYEAQQGQTYGVSATQNARPIDSIVAHHTGSPTLSSALNSARRGDPFTGNKFGYHFYIDTDGTVVQGAPMDARTNHVQPPGAVQRTSRPDISNSNAVGISFVGTGSNPTPEQLGAAKNLSAILMDRYGITPENVVGHGEIQNNRQTSEGMPLVNAVRAAPVAVAQNPTGPQMAGTANAAPTKPTQPKSDWWAADPVAEKPKSKDVGRLGAAVAGAEQGISANFSDEARGASAAAGLSPLASTIARGVPFIGPAIEPAIGAARVGYEAIAGGDEATKRYEAAKEAARQRYKASQEQYPGTYLAGNIVGALAVPGGPALQAATLPARIGRGAAVGAVYGGLSGAGEGTDAGSRAIGAATGAAGGAVVGAVAAPVLSGVEAVGRGIAAAASPAVNAFRGAINPEREAARRVVSSIERDARAAGTELSPQEFAAARAAGIPVSIQELGGETTRALARSAANTSPEARATLQKLADDRFEGQTDRATTFIRNIAGVSTDTGATREALKTAARTANEPAYRKAYTHPSAQGMWDEGFEQIAQAPVVQNAIRAASITAANRGTAEGFQRIPSPFTIDKATGQLQLRVDAEGNRILPNLQFWDHVKRNLDKINTPEARTLNDALKAHLDDLVPDYKKARAGAARFFDADDALGAGENFVRSNMPLQDAARALKSMSEAERNLFKVGFTAKLVNDLNGVRDRVNVFNQIAQTPNARTKLQMVLGRDGYRQLEALTSVESSIDKLRGALGNSSTVRQWVELGLAGSIGGSGIWNSDPTQMAVAGAIAGRRWVDTRVAKKVADMLTSSDPNVLSQGIRMVASNKTLTNAFRDLDTRLSKVGVQQAPALQAPAVGRADEQSVPRPPGQ